MPLADQSQDLRSLLTLRWEKVFVYLRVNLATAASTVFSVISELPRKHDPSQSGLFFKLKAKAENLHLLFV